jgi:hypothetical protein
LHRHYDYYYYYQQQVNVLLCCNIISAASDGEDLELIVIRGEDIISLFFIVLTGTLLVQTLITKSLSLMMPSGLPFPLTTTNELTLLSL